MEILLNREDSEERNRNLRQPNKTTTTSNSTSKPTYIGNEHYKNQNTRPNWRENAQVKNNSWQKEPQYVTRPNNNYNRNRYPSEEQKTLCHSLIKMTQGSEKIRI